MAIAHQSYMISKKNETKHEIGIGNHHKHEEKALVVYKGVHMLMKIYSKGVFFAFLITYKNEIPKELDPLVRNE